MQAARAGEPVEVGRSSTTTSRTSSPGVGDASRRSPTASPPAHDVRAHDLARPAGPSADAWLASSVDDGDERRPASARARHDRARPRRRQAGAPSAWTPRPRRARRGRRRAGARRDALGRGSAPARHRRSHRHRAHRVPRSCSARSPGGRPRRPPSVEHLFVERLYDVYQHPADTVETRSNRCLIRRPDAPRLAVQAQAHHEPLTRTPGAVRRSDRAAVSWQAEQAERAARRPPDGGAAQ